MTKTSFVDRNMKLKNSGISARKLFSAALLIMLGGVMAGCDGGDKSTAEATSTTDVAVATISETAYVITKDESLATIKRTVEVQIEEPISEEVLERLANKIRSQRTTQYERTFIGWRLAGQATAPYWATTNFNPDLRVEILNF